MSKRDFSEKIIETMEKKIKAIESIDPDEFAKKDEYFELVICLAYMTLSKEKIIDKDKNNKNKTGRLTENVDRSEINKVFDPSFSKEMPIIINTAVNDNVWMLDNIRDSIMHGQFDIDENKKCFILNNTQANRLFQAEVPFSWFIAYAKNNILDQKETEKIEVKGFFYNKEKENDTEIRVYKEIMNSIFYKVKIEGNKVNYSEVEKTVKELFAKYSKDEIDESVIEQYRTRIDSESYAYDEKYLVSYYIAADKVLKDLQVKYPNDIIDIVILKQKEKNKVIEDKNLPKKHKSYKLLMSTLNELESEKGMDSLKKAINLVESYNNPRMSFALSKLISKSLANINFDIDAMMNRKNPKYLLLQGVNQAIKSLNQSMMQETMSTALKTLMEVYEDFGEKGYRLSQMVDGTPATNNYEKYMLFSKNRDALIEKCISAFGLASLTINHKELYEPHFQNSFTSDYVDSSNSVSKYKEIIDGINKYKTDILEENETIAHSNRVIKKLYDENGVCRNITEEAKRKTIIYGAKSRITTYNVELGKLETKLSRLSVPKTLSPKQKKIKRQHERRIRRLENNYYKIINSDNYDKKSSSNEQRVLALLKSAMNEYKEATAEYMAIKCERMDETVEIMRNSLSHVGRIKVKGTKIIFEDYDNDGKKSGQVICEYEAFKNILTEPYQKQKTLGTQI